MSSQSLPIRSRAIAVLVLRRGVTGWEALLLQRASGPFHEQWCIVTGGLEAGERTADAAVREVLEETGLADAELFTADYCDVFYNPHEDTIEIIPIFFAIVPQDAAVTINHENLGFRWMPILDAADTVPFVGHSVAMRALERRLRAGMPAEWMRMSPYRPSEDRAPANG